MTFTNSGVLKGVFKAIIQCFARFCILRLISILCDQCVFSVLSEFNICKFKNRSTTPYKVPKPQNYNRMIEIATILFKDFSHVRVNLYNVDDKIYFGEMTFTSSGGDHLIAPEKYNYLLVDL